jgi:hypothetical protein
MTVPHLPRPGRQLRQVRQAATRVHAWLLATILAASVGLAIAAAPVAAHAPVSARPALADTCAGSQFPC